LTTATARIEGAKIFLGFVFSLLLSTRVLRTKNVAENRKKTSWQPDVGRSQLAVDSIWMYFLHWCLRVVYASNRPILCL